MRNSTKSKEADLPEGDDDGALFLTDGLFAGEPGAYRDMVLLNAAAALVIAEKADNLAAGVGRAAEAIDSGLANMALVKLIECSNA